MTKLYKYILFTSLLIIFLALAFSTGYLTKMSENFVLFKTNFVDELPTELWFIFDTFIFGYIVFLIRNW